MTPTPTLCARCGHPEMEHFKLPPRRCDGGSLNVGCSCVGFTASLVSASAAPSAVSVSEPADAAMVEALENLEDDLTQHYRNSAWLPAPQTSAGYAAAIRQIRSRLHTSESRVAELTAALQQQNQGWTMNDQPQEPKPSRDTTVIVVPAGAIEYAPCRCGHGSGSHNSLKFNCLATTDGTHATRCSCKAFISASLP